jgi:hypothetical protein
MLEPRRLNTLRASTACYRDSFAFTYKEEQAYVVQEDKVVGEGGGGVEQRVRNFVLKCAFVESEPNTDLFSNVYKPQVVAAQICIM